MGRRICAPVPASSSLQSLVEAQVPFSSSTAQASISQSFIDTLFRSYDASVLQFLKKLSQHSFVITDPHLRGHPIVYASDAFLNMSGYRLEEVLGRNPKFLQGLDTSRQSVFQLRDSIGEQKPCQITLLNYTKQGWPFLIALHMAPVFSQHDGQLLHFVGVQKPLYDFSLRLQKHTVQSAPVLLELQRGSCACLLQEGLSNIMSGFDAHWQTGISIGSQKKKMKLASAVLQLLIYELTKSNELKIAGTSYGRFLCENADTALCSSLTLALTRIQQSFVILNPNVPGMPVLYASDKFLHSTGSCKEEVVGRSCSFLQGQERDVGVFQEMWNCVLAEKACTLQFVNHRKDGSPFWNLWHVAPIRDHSAKFLRLPGCTFQLGDISVICVLRVVRHAFFNISKAIVSQMRSSRGSYDKLQLICKRLPCLTCFYENAPNFFLGKMVVYVVGVPWEVGSPDCCHRSDIAPVKQQLAIVGAIKVAVRSLRGQGLRRSFNPLKAL